MRLSSNSRITPGAVSPDVALNLLHKLTGLPDHQFWPDTIALCDAVIFQKGGLLGYRQVTDAYLFSLAIYNNGLLVTFDKGIAKLDPEAAQAHLFLLEG